MSARGERTSPASGGFRVVGREAEKSRLHQAIRNRESLFICGPAGMGKTTLISQVLAELPEALSRVVITVNGADGLQPLLRALLQNLHEAGDSALGGQLRSERVGSAGFKRWLNSQPSSRLKGALCRSSQSGRYWVFLDHLPRLTPAIAKVVRELVWMLNTPVYVAARGAGPEDAGDVANIYWSDGHRLVLPPLHAAAARELLESCIRRFNLSRLDLRNFREAVLSMSGHNPGALVGMCKLAAEPRYHYGSSIKTRMIYIDHLMSLSGRHNHPAGSARPE